MKFNIFKYRILCIVCALSCAPLVSFTQTIASPGMSGGEGSSGLNRMPGANFGRGGVGADVKTDSLGNIQSDWDDTPAKIYYTYLNTHTKQHLDTSLTYFHRHSRILQWGRNLGNEGAPAYDMIFNPITTLGGKSGYNVFDLYKISLDSIKFYNTTRPYSDFGFMMGSKKHQFVRLLHTQNINPDWNFAFDAKNLVAPGFFSLQTARNVSANFATTYKSKNQRYQVKAVLNYHRFKHDENGGILDDSLLLLDRYNNRSLVDVQFPGKNFSTTVAAVNNIHNELQFLFQQDYAAIGVRDTLYNEDSTKIDAIFLPRFTFHHTLFLQNQNTKFNDQNPTDERYLHLTKRPYDFKTTDSVYTQQLWFKVDNRLGVGGTIGKNLKTANLQLGLGNRIDYFKNQFPGDERRFLNNYVSNYIYGKLFKEALEGNEWAYNADAEMYFTGNSAGNFKLDAYVSKVVWNVAMLDLGFNQVLTDAPYFYQNYANNFFERTTTLDAYSVTALYGNITVPKLKLSLGLRNQILANYIYLDENIAWQQQSEAFNVLQLYVQKHFKFGNWYNENEVILQQATPNAPVNLPTLMLRHQIRYEAPMFKSNLLVSIGLEGRYHTDYYGNGYTPYLNQFYYQNTYLLKNKPEIMAFLNFKIKAFRAFVVLDQLQQMVWTNNIYAKGYPITNTVFRFGFNWVLYN
jgi:hypothetical protein